MPEKKDPSDVDVYRQLADVLQKTLNKLSEVEQTIIKDLESIRRQLDAVGVLKDNIANLNNRIDTLSKRLTELSKSEPQELSRLMIRTINELDKRMQMFTITEVLSRAESGGYSTKSRQVIQAPAPVQPTATPSPSKPEATPSVTPAPAATQEKDPDAVGESAKSDKPWRESMREKYGLKKKPGKL